MIFRRKIHSFEQTDAVAVVVAGLFAKRFDVNVEPLVVAGVPKRLDARVVAKEIQHAYKTPKFLFFFSQTYDLSSLLLVLQITTVSLLVLRKDQWQCLSLPMKFFDYLHNLRIEVPEEDIFFHVKTRKFDVSPPWISFHRRT